jgi:integrase
VPRIRKSGDGGLYHDAKRDLWIGVVDIGFTPEGKRKQKRVTSRSQSTARDKLREVLDQVATTGSPLGNSTVAQWGAVWVEGFKDGKPQTYRTFKSLLKTWVFPVIGRKNVKDVRPSDMKRIYDNIKLAGRAGGTALKVHNVMSAMFEAARLERLTTVNVTKSIRPPRAAKTNRGTLSPDETGRILEASRVDGSKWWVSLYAGIRQGERLGATIDSIDFNRSLFTVQWNLVEGNYEHGCDGQCGKKASGHCPQKRLLIPDGMDSVLLGGRYMLVPPKSGEPRTFPLTIPLLDMLERHIISLQSQPNPHGLLWPNPDGTPISGRRDQEQWRALLVAAEVDRPAATTHWARHTAISDMSAAGVVDRTIGEMVGHKSPGVTGRYQHVSSQDAAEGMRKLGERRQV